MYIYKTDLYLYKNVYRSINQSTMYFRAERSELEVSEAEMEFVFSFVLSAVVSLVREWSVSSAAAFLFNNPSEKSVPEEPAAAVWSGGDRLWVCSGVKGTGALKVRFLALGNKTVLKKKAAFRKFKEHFLFENKLR